MARHAPDYHTPDAQFVAGRLVRLVEERAGNVACAVAQEQYGVRDDLFGMACGVGDLE